MILHTIGREFYSQDSYPLKVYRDMDNIPDIPLGEVYQIIIIEEGTGIIKLNQERIIIRAPVVYLVNELESVTLIDNLNLRIHIIYFNPVIINKKLDFNYIRQQANEYYDSSPELDLYLLNSFVFRDHKYYGYYQLTQIMLYRLLYLKDYIFYEYEDQQSSLWLGRGRVYFLEMLCYLSGINIESLQEMGPVMNFTVEMFDDVLLYIHANYSQKITLQKLVNTFNINHTTLNNMFRKATGESVISYIIKLRIENSAFLLKNTDFPVKEIAYQVGYNDIANYGRAFRKYKGCNPKKYREENKR